MRRPSLYFLQAPFLDRTGVAETAELKNVRSPICNGRVNVLVQGKKVRILTMILRSLTVVDLLAVNDPCSSYFRFCRRRLDCLAPSVRAYVAGLE